MKPQVIFVGGIHGAGKTTLCLGSSRFFECKCIRQIHLVADLGKNGGFSWEQSIERHDELIELAAGMVVSGMMRSHEELLIADCHYAIRTSRALRVKNRPPISDPYIPDLDKRFVSILSDYMVPRFILIDVKPEVAVARIERRSIVIPSPETTIEGLSELKPVEEEMFRDMLSVFECKDTDCLIIENNASLEDALSAIKNFIRN